MTNEEKREELEQQITDLESELDSFEISDHVDESQYDDMIDEVCGPIEILGLSYCASRVLAEIDPTAYSCGFNDYCDSLDVSDIEEYQDLESQLEELKDELESLTEELES